MEDPRSYNLTKNMVLKLLEPAIQDFRNKDAFLSLIYHQLSQHNVETAIAMIWEDKDYYEFKMNDIVKIKNKCDESEREKLQDRGLATTDARFGIILGDTSWSSEGFNPFYYKLKVEVYGMDWETNELQTHEEEVSPQHLEKVEEIPYFSAKNKLDGKSESHTSKK